MSSGGTTGSNSTTSSNETLLQEISSGVSTVVNMLAPVAEMAFPAASAALSIGQKIIQGVISAEPMAVSLFNQIKSGTPATPAQLAQYQASYEAAYQQLNSDLNAKIASATS